MVHFLRGFQASESRGEDRRRQVSERAVRPLVIVDLAVVVPEHPRFKRGVEDLTREKLRAFPMKLSTKGVCQGLPGWM